MHLRKRTKRKLLSFVLVALIFGAVLVSTDHIKLPIGLTDGTNGPPSLHIGNTTAYFIDVGQGDSILIVTGDNRTVLIDAGGSTSASVVVSFIQNLSIGVIDAFVLTHPDADHIGWSDEVLEAFDVLAIYHSGFVKDTAIQ
ncbi:MAG TPA: MBL fold metallo-hydrolase [Methanomassiliicoccaceae archaeon]|nr:MBL fold metallo-hydrolase [Methanomassiliicoccaceae archaeon]